MTSTLDRPAMSSWDDDYSVHPKLSWQRERACQGADLTLFFPEDGDGVELAYPPPEAKKICDQCPVRAECLTLYMNEEFGIFGGMTGYQRSLLTKKKHRKRCVGCGSTDVITENKHDLCLGCGLSWEVL